ncbi:hypothetical protein DFJ58DRAFT_909747 [Suillus subalutaceus]|uniref:uncharacterized protein n=1 Tax=Suillus subalutaceus TaxID=48586 RepID=UPI001B87817E|nr:uncharacterized protein DFJ58DRAFT_909747 [Suillus subalutaceus]KAG1876466.1 hypothetical protein DFJ58DRAFT_909747 [Suillus subalutaceus]
MVSTLLEIEPSVQDEVAVNMIWPYKYRTVDMQTNSLLSPIFISQPSTRWEMNQFEWSNTSWPVQVYHVIGRPESHLQSKYGGSLPISNFTLRPDELELAVAKAAAQLIWLGKASPRFLSFCVTCLAGQLGTSNGAIQRGNGTAYVNEEFIALRLNINLLPLTFAVSASVIMLGLALQTTRAFDASHDSQAVIPNIGSCGWVMEDVHHPIEANLRRAGEFNY